MKKIIAKEGKQALDLSLTREEIRQKHKEEMEKEAKDKAPKRRIEGNKELSLSSYDEPSEEGNEQSDYDDKLAMEIDFSSEEDEEELGGITVKNMGRLLNAPQFKPQKEGVINPNINMSNYYNVIQKKGKPDSPTYK